MTGSPANVSNCDEILSPLEGGLLFEHPSDACAKYTLEQHPLQCGDVAHFHRCFSNALKDGKQKKSAGIIKWDAILGGGDQTMQMDGEFMGFPFFCCPLFGARCNLMTP